MLRVYARAVPAGMVDYVAVWYLAMYGVPRYAVRSPARTTKVKAAVTVLV